MENSQVSWENAVSYEDLVKQCPYFAQRRGLPLESQLCVKQQVSEVILSKSKKKRLKRRLKTLSIQPPNSDGLVAATKPKDPTSSTSCSDLTSSQSESHLLKTEKEEKPRTMDKQKKVADVVDGEILQTNIKVNREQVLLDREARKKMKLLTKQKKGIVPPKEDVPTKLPSQNGSVKEISIETKADKLQAKPSAVNKQESKNEIKTVKSDLIPNESKSRDGTHSNSAQNTDKTREEILAEREAKKQAKQLAKLKKIDKQSEVKSHTEGIIKNDDNKKIVEPQIAVTKSQTSLGETKLPPDVDKAETGKSKSELRAERRAKQEAQRAAKEAEKKLKLEATENKENKIVSPAVKKRQTNKESAKETKAAVKQKIVSQQRIKLFSHLHFGEKPALTQINETLHPSIIELGVKYSARIINGSNARCVALLNCLKEVITDYTTPLEKEFSRGLESKLGELTNYINQCRPMSVSMTNALRHIKSHLTQLPNNVSDEEAKRKLFDVIDTFIREQIDVAGEAICESVKNKIANGDVILIYSCSSLLYRILAETHRSGREFSVVVVDGGPWFEGREMLRRLVAAGLKCTYVQVSAISFIMKQATKVLLGAHALLANGCVMSRAGASIVALSAHSFNVPVLVCCETYKFCERVQTDAFVYNELGNPDDLAKEDERLSNWQSLNFLSPLNLVYDITPPDLITAVVTEIAILPCTSVPVILRVKPSDVVS